MKSIGSKILIGLLVVFVILQFFGIDRSVPETDPSKDLMAVHEPPVETAMLLKDACYDCHSYDTDYPWYSYIAPVSWWLQDHINEARDEVNFSLWTDYSPGDADHIMEEAVELVEEEEMPLPSYTWAHSEARLTEEQEKELIDWFNSVRSEIQSSPKTGSAPDEEHDHSDHEH